MSPEDSMDHLEVDVKRLERLYDYTKFHIGVYLTLVGAFVAAMADKVGIVDPCSRWFFMPAIAAMLLAGVAGGVIASHLPEAGTFSEFEKQRISFLKRWFRRRYVWWAKVEHRAFWIGILWALAVIAARPGVSELRSRHPIIWLCGCA
jgi:hypothetical protein